ncbi:MAG: hypothetical protein OIF35_05660 [Cellvibrionaceae bacterium]|nr:hypothetical protein [Cellvibrionaceae bacterium]
MPLSDADRQKRYRERMEAGGVKRYQVMLPQSVAEQVRELTSALNCTKGELFTQLIDEKYKQLVMDGSLSEAAKGK